MCCPRASIQNKCNKNSTDHQGVSSLCWFCKVKVENVTYMVSPCSVLAGNQYKKRHDKLGKKVHWLLLCSKFEIECENKWFSHQPESVLENDICKILWDFAIQTDKEIEHRKPDIVVIDKEKRECKIINIAVPGDQTIKVKELEKITKYQDLDYRCRSCGISKLQLYLSYLVQLVRNLRTIEKPL